MKPPTPGRLEPSRAALLIAQKKDEIIKLLKYLGEMLVWSDNNELTDLFDAFFEVQTHKLILTLLPHESPPSGNAGDPAIAVALLRFFNVIFESVEQENVLYFLFSNNYINDVIRSTATFSKDAGLSISSDD
ncbi:hypothetical protein HK405_011150, partial [Cladochytrium tenue]